MIYTSMNVIEVGDWDNLVKETYGKPYNFQQQEGCKEKGVLKVEIPSTPYDFENDTLPEKVNHLEMGVSFKAWLARDPKQPLPNQKCDYELEMWWERNFYPDYQMIANDLYSKGLLLAGNYLININ